MAVQENDQLPDQQDKDIETSERVGQNWLDMAAKNPSRRFYIYLIILDPTNGLVIKKFGTISSSAEEKVHNVLQGMFAP